MGLCKLHFLRALSQKEPQDLLGLVGWRLVLQLCRWLSKNDETDNSDRQTSAMQGIWRKTKTPH